MKMIKLNQKGAAMVEMAIVLPLLFMISFGIIEFGILLYDKAMITNASREGARAGIVYAEPSITDAEIINVVDNYCASHLISFSTSASPPSTQVTRTTESFGPALRVQVTYQYNFLVLPNFVTGLLSTLTLDSQTIMRCEGNC